MLNTEPTVKIDAHIVGLDEKSLYVLSAELDKYIKAVRSVYLYDKNTVTYCCELTPSYYMRQLYVYPELSDEGQKLPEDEQERIHDMFAEVCDNCYMHCSTVDRLTEEAKKSGYWYHPGKTGASYDDTPYEVQMEELYEEYRCNHVL